MLKRVKNIIKKVHLRDFAAPFIFLFMLIPSFVFRLLNRRKKLWLIAEEGEARDNGYYFFKYVRETHPDDFCFYAIKPKSADYNKVAKLGNVIKYGGLKHWLYYMSADLNISSQTIGNPSMFFWHFMHVILGLYKNRVFLQHGITKDDSPALHYENIKFKYFITGADAEYVEISKKFGYPEGAVVLTGFPRWDNLRNNNISSRSILIMPTWRNYLEVQNNPVFKKNNFKESMYFNSWNGLINDREFINFVEQNDIDVYFYPHQNVQKELATFNSSSKKIKIVSMNEDISKYLSESALMITDYSSVAFDFAYLEKPVIYFQFDVKEYREKQHGEGYFSYEKDGFGPVVDTESEVVDEMEHYFKFGVKEKYIRNLNNFFRNRDKNNSKRVYEVLK